MTRRRRILGIAFIVLLLTLASLAFALSHDAPCAAPDPPPRGTATIDAIVQRCYGPPDALSFERVAKPVPADDEVLVEVRAAAVNPLDWHYTTGTPYVMRLSSGIGRPKDIRMGVDFAGTVEAVGRNVTRFKAGDAVFGGRSGALGEYVAVREDRAIAHKPSNLSFEQAAAIPVAATTALQGLRDHGRIRPGQRVLINGASGGVGTFAVQIAKAYGAEVTGVCSTRNVALVRSIGADQVIDYTQADFTQGGRRYDLILDNVGNHGLMAMRSALKPGGTLVMVGGPKRDPWLGPLSRTVKALLLAPFVDVALGKFLADLNQDDLRVIADLAQAGKVTPVIDRRYALRDSPEAIRYLGTGRARGKVVIDVE